MLEVILNPQFLTLLGVLGAGFAGLAKAFQWYITRLDNKRREAHQEEMVLRDKIQQAFEDRVRSLEIDLGVQREQVKHLTEERKLFLKRIYQLEAYIQYSRLDVPVLEGWPPE